MKKIASLTIALVLGCAGVAMAQQQALNQQEISAHLTQQGYTDVHDLKFAGLNETSESNEVMTFREARARFEKEFLIQKINENNGNISRTAEIIGLERSYLHRKIKAYGIEG